VRTLPRRSLPAALLAAVMLLTGCGIGSSTSETASADARAERLAAHADMDHGTMDHGDGEHAARPPEGRAGGADDRRDAGLRCGPWTRPPRHPARPRRRRTPPGGRPPERHRSRQDRHPRHRRRRRRHRSRAPGRRDHGGPHRLRPGRLVRPRTRARDASARRDRRPRRRPIGTRRLLPAHRARAGDLIEVHGEDGEVVVFEVREVRAAPEGRLPDRARSTAARQVPSCA
jgi:hypothetical protein